MIVPWRPRNSSSVNTHDELIGSRTWADLAGWFISLVLPLWCHFTLCLISLMIVCCWNYWWHGRKNLLPSFKFQNSLVSILSCHKSFGLLIGVLIRHFCGTHATKGKNARFSCTQPKTENVCSLYLCESERLPDSLHVSQIGGWNVWGAFEEVTVRNAISFGIDRRSIGMLWHGVYVFHSSVYVIWHVFASWVGRTNKYQAL